LTLDFVATLVQYLEIYIICLNPYYKDEEFFVKFLLKTRY